MNTYSPQSIGVKSPTGGFQEGGWYSGRQYIGGTLSDPGVIHPGSSQQGSGERVSEEVNRQSDKAQGNEQGDIERYLQAQRDAQRNATPTQNIPSGSFSGAGSTGTSTGGTGAGLGVAPQSEFNLPELYKGLVTDSGIKNLEEEYTGMNKEFVEAKGKINDNPFLSEATRVGRVAKIESLFAERTQGIRDEIATKKADVETQLNLQLKQFDINSQQAKDAQDQLNFLLTSGALANASGEDIATLTRSTGYSSSMIMSAIESSKPGRETQVIQTEDDNGVVTVSVVDKNTGEIVNQSSLGAIGTRTKTSSGSTTITKQQLQSATIQDLEEMKNPYGHISPEEWAEELSYWIQGGGTREDFNKNFQQYADPNRGDFDKVYFERE